MARLTTDLLPKTHGGYFVQRVKVVKSKRYGVNVARRAKLTVIFKRHSGWKIPARNRI